MTPLKGSIVSRGLWAAVVLLATSGLCRAAIPVPLCQAKVAASLDALARGNYALATRDFDGPLARNHDPANLRLVWASLLRQTGAFRGRAVPSWKAVEGHRYVFTTMKFARGSAVALDACDQTGRIKFFEWGPSSNAAEKIRTARPHDYPDGVRELPMTVASAWGPLPATLALPKGNGPFPAVLLVAGAGKNDQDESLGPNKPFRDLALGLARAGIASLRYDKSITAYPSQAGLSLHLTIDDEVTYDALTGLERLRAQRRIDPDRVFLLGHSLGAMMAPRIARRAGPHLAGVVMMAPPALPLLVNAVRQVRYLDALQHAPPATLQRQLKSIRDEQQVLAHAASARLPAGDFVGMPQSWWLSLQGYDQVAVARSLTLPMLILQGARDYQVQPAYNFSRWREVFARDPGVRLIEYSGLSHVFMPAGDPPSPADYARPAHVDGRVIRDIARWVLARDARH